MKKLTINQVKEICLNKGYILLDDVYVNNKNKLNVLCPNCNTKTELYLFQISKNVLCKKCGFEKISKKKKIRDSKKIKTNKKEILDLLFESEGCKLLSTKIFTEHTYVDYICSCGNKSNIQVYSFRNGHRCRKCGLKKIRKTRELKYNQTPLKELTNFQYYKRLVYSLTQKTYNKSKDVINPNNLPRGVKKYHLDHKYSIRNGFRNNILPIVISNVNNLQMLSENENLSKNFKNSITKKELFEKYNGK